MRKYKFASCAIASAACILFLCIVFILTRNVLSFENPPDAFEQSELFGVWNAQYDGNSDKLIIYEDGSFEQSYNQSPNYQFESGKGTWFLERFPDGRIRIHLTGARYYRASASFFEHYGYTRPFYDPFSKNSVIMDNELILEVVYQNTGQLILHHMLLGPDEGFPLLDTGQGYFKKSPAKQ